MSYTPTTWAAGDTITSAKLNKLEQGIKNNGSWIIPIIEIENELEDDENTINEAAQDSEESNISYQLGDGTITYKMIEDALENGRLIITKGTYYDSRINGNTVIYEPEQVCLISFLSNNEEVIGYMIRFYTSGYDFGADTKTDPLVYNWTPSIASGEFDPSGGEK